MAANTSPIFLRQPNVGFNKTNTTGITSTDGSDANVKLVFTADATNGSKVEDVYVVYSGTAVATVIRFWVNNGSVNTTAANNALVHEETLAANTVSQTAASIQTVWRANLVLNPGYRLYCAVGTTIANAVAVTAVGGDY